MKLAIVILLFVHGLIHIMGFVHEWKFSVIRNFTGKTLIPLGTKSRKATGVLWLSGTLLFITAGMLLLFEPDNWWIWALVAVIISQVLIILYWKDARFGTIFNALILFAALAGYGSWRLNTMVKEEVKQAFAHNPARDGSVVTREMIARTPLCVQRWLERSGITGKEMIRTLRLKQHGQMRTKPQGKWMPFEAEQYYTIQRPSFIWKARIASGAGFFLSARDKYDNGEGNMWIQALSLYTISNSSGPEMDQGALLRYLAEGCWYPSMLLSPYIGWTGIDSLTARATMSYKNMTASGIFTFTPEGEVKSFDALRYREFEGTYQQERWHVDVRDYQNFEGIRIPTVAEVTWKLPSGDFNWLKLSINGVGYNVKGVY
jgi:hypothetical protein